MKKIIVSIILLIIAYTLGYNLIFGNFITEDIQWYRNDMQLNETLQISQGSNITIGLIDSGVRDDIHILKEYNFSSSKDTYDTNGHGSTSALLMQDVAPKAEIYSYKVMDDESKISSEAVNLALEQAIKDQVDVLCIPLGTHSRNDKTTSLINELTSNGTIILSSAGDYNESKLMYPAELENVISVGAYDQDKVHWSQNNADDEIDIWFPGVDIATYHDESYLFEPYNYQSGTSFATALATGYLAILLEINREISNENFISIMQQIEKGDKSYLDFLQ